MASSGIPLSSECKHVFDQIRRLKQHRYAVFVIEDELQIRVEWLGDREAGYEDFLLDLRRAGPEHCRFAVYDYECQRQYPGLTVGRPKEKLFLMLWCPSQANVKDKMLYSSTFATLKQEFDGVHKCIQATELDEILRYSVEKQLGWD